MGPVNVIIRENLINGVWEVDTEFVGDIYFKREGAETAIKWKKADTTREHFKKHGLCYEAVHPEKFFDAFLKDRVRFRIIQSNVVTLC